MDDNFFDEYDNSIYPLTDMFEKVSDKTYLQFCQIACIQYDFLLNTRFLSGYHLVNWRVNFGNLHDFVKEKNHLTLTDMAKKWENISYAAI